MELNSEQIDVLKDAIGTFGEAVQMDMAIEEMAELTKELCKVKRGREHDVHGEMADVYIMMRQLELMFVVDTKGEHIDKVQRLINQKVARLACRLSEHRQRSINKINADQAGFDNQNNYQ